MALKAADGEQVDTSREPSTGTPQRENGLLTQLLAGIAQER